MYVYIKSKISRPLRTVASALLHISSTQQMAVFHLTAPAMNSEQHEIRGKRSILLKFVHDERFPNQQLFKLLPLTSNLHYECTMPRKKTYRHNNTLRIVSDIYVCKNICIYIYIYAYTHIHAHTPKLKYIGPSRHVN